MMKGKIGTSMSMATKKVSGAEVWLSMKSKYEGTCWECKGRLKKGSSIQYNPEWKKARHAKCPRKPKGKVKNAGVLLPNRRARFVTGR